MKYVLLEMDRILRPNGYAIIRESSYFVDAVATLAKGMKWGCRKEETEYGVEQEKILICQKKLWYSSKQSSRWWDGIGWIWMKDELISLFTCRDERQIIFYIHIIRGIQGKKVLYCSQESFVQSFQHKEEKKN